MEDKVSSEEINWVVNLDYQQLYPNIQKSYGIYPERLKIIRRITKIKRLFNPSI